MRKSFLFLSSLLVCITLLGITFPVDAQTGATSTASITTVVTTLGPKYTPPPAIGKDDIAVYVEKQKQEITSWVPAQGDKAGLMLAILIDDATNTELGAQLGDLTNFIKELPKTTSVGVFYADNGAVQPASQFVSDHEAAAKAVRMPMGRIGAYSSIYLSVMNLISSWPETGARREILLISDGIDRFRGDPFSPDVQTTVDKAQKAGVMIHTLYATGVGRVSRNMFRVNYGQSNLGQLADGTGGEAFFQGLQTPVAFAPFLEQLDMVLRNQYFLTFVTGRSKKAKGELRGIRIRTEQRNVELSHAERVFVPGP
jgi:hypothetical protein